MKRIITMVVRLSQVIREGLKKTSWAKLSYSYVKLIRSFDMFGR